MRYIGSKENLLGFIEDSVAAQGITGGTLCDLFAGTTTVGRHFKRRGFRVLSNDLMYYSYVFGKAYLENNSVPDFAGLDLPHRASLFDMDTELLAQAPDYLNAIKTNALPNHIQIFYRYGNRKYATNKRQESWFCFLGAYRYGSYACSH